MKIFFDEFFFFFLLKNLQLWSNLIFFVGVDWRRSGGIM